MAIENPSRRQLSVSYTHLDVYKRQAGGSGTNLGTGGMSTKIIAADVATRSGIETIIAPVSYTHLI